MGLIGQMGLRLPRRKAAPPQEGERTNKTNNRHYESDEDLGFGFDGGRDAAGGMPTGEGDTGEDCAC